ncbi:hypothetical protein NLJ89_g1225 [Agrocybe chaxingu]|uniref:Uncharacterized protein n=1 Tax=Agrocybe chaxingu TaxID=84603 RepID=A0A9W8TDN7_9AGAR|nr:hypothetical protein NLJ89_g1225 [Agrocybe chaxingu]
MSEPQRTIARLPPPTQAKLRSTQILTSLPQIVSELVQNSLDAEATHVDVGIDAKEWICWVRDDGRGISKGDLELLGQGEECARYNTSKTYAPGDSNSLSTFGFRGEALVSAADVSCLEICSRTSKSRNTWSIILKGGKQLYVGPAYVEAIDVALGSMKLEGFISLTGAASKVDFRGVDDSGYAEQNSISELSVLSVQDDKPEMASGNFYTSTDGPDEVTWLDRATGEHFVVNTRTGHSRTANRSSQAGNEPCHAAIANHGEGRRTLRQHKTNNPAVVDTSARQDPLPKWLEQALESNRTYAITENRIPSVQVPPATHHIASTNDPFNSHQHAADERVRVEGFLKELCLGFLESPNRIQSGEAVGVRVREVTPPRPVLLTQHEALTIKRSPDVQAMLRKWGVRFVELSRVDPVSDSISDSGSSTGYSQLLSFFVDPSFCFVVRDSSFKETNCGISLRDSLGKSKVENYLQILASCLLKQPKTNFSGSGLCEAAQKVSLTL